MKFTVAQDFTSLVELLRFYGDADEIVFKSHTELAEAEIAEACHEGRGLANRLRLRNGSKTAEEIATSYGCQIVREAWQVAEGKMIILGECLLHQKESGAVIRVNTDAMKSLAELMAQWADDAQRRGFSEAKIAEVVVAHELFHLVQQRPASTAFELAAHSFARAMTDLPFSPLLYNALLIRLATGEENFDDMKYFLGIDGGQSHTTALIAGDNGRILGRGVAGASNHTREPGGRERLITAVTKSVGEALTNAGLLKQPLKGGTTNALAGFEFTSAHLAMTGEPEDKVEIVNELLRADHLVVGHDAPGALAGALAGGEGVIVLAGTGSVACGETADGKFARVGGHGYMFGDEGSGFMIARNALSQGLILEDSGCEGELKKMLLAHFKRPSLKAIAEDFYAGKLSRERLASFAAQVSKLAKLKVVEAVEILVDAGESLSDMAVACVCRLGMQYRESIRISYGGGVFKSRTVMNMFIDDLAMQLLNAKVVRPSFGPDAGALLLAYRQAGKKITPELLANIAETQKQKR